MTPRTTFEKGLQELRERIKTLGEQVDQALYQAVQSLRLHQQLLSEAVIKQDEQINQQRFALEEAALTLIATQSPVAHDLRFVAGTMYISTELERMGDHAKGIARINIMMAKEGTMELPQTIEPMTEICRTMLREALDAFAKLDASTARQVAAQDDELDNLYNATNLDLLKLMRDDQSLVDRATHMSWVAHNLERFGDRCVNICERVIFVATGEMTEIRGHLNG